MTEFFTEKLKEVKVPDNIQQAILRELTSLESDLRTRIFIALSLYQQEFTPLGKVRAATTLYYADGLQFLLLTKCGLQDPIVSQILSVFSGEATVSSSGK